MIGGGHGNQGVHTQNDDRKRAIEDKQTDEGTQAGRQINKQG